MGSVNVPSAGKPSEGIGPDAAISTSAGVDSAVPTGWTNVQVLLPELTADAWVASRLPSAGKLPLAFAPLGEGGFPGILYLHI